jgi:hypothetical protein
MQVVVVKLEIILKTADDLSVGYCGGTSCVNICLLLL